MLLAYTPLWSEGTLAPLMPPIINDMSEPLRPGRIQRVAGPADSRLFPYSAGTTTRWYFNGGAGAATRFRFRFSKVDSGILVFAISSDNSQYPLYDGDDIETGRRWVNEFAFRFLETTGGTETNRVELALRAVEASASSSSSPSSSEYQNADVRWEFTTDRAGAQLQKTHAGTATLAVKGFVHSQHVIILNLDEKRAWVLSGGPAESPDMGGPALVLRPPMAFRGECLNTLWNTGDEDPSDGSLSFVDGGIDTLEIEIGAGNADYSMGPHIEVDHSAAWLGLAHQPWMFIGDEVALSTTLLAWRDKYPIAIIPVATFYRRLVEQTTTAARLWQPPLTDPEGCFVGVIESGCKKIILGAGSHDIGQAGFVSPCLEVTYTGAEATATMQVLGTANDASTGVVVTIGATTTTLSVDDYPTLRSMRGAIEAVDAGIETAWYDGGVNMNRESSRLLPTASPQSIIAPEAASSSSSSESASVGHTFDWHDHQRFVAMRNTLAGLVDRALANDCSVVLCTLLPRGSASFPAQTRVPIAQADVTAFNAFIQDLADKHDLPCLDVYDLLEDGDGLYADASTLDGISPSYAAGATLAAALYDLLMPGQRVNVSLIQGEPADDWMAGQLSMAIESYNLQYLLSEAPSSLGGAVIDGSVFAHALAVDADVSGFLGSTDSLEALRDAIDLIGGAAALGATTTAYYTGEGFIARCVDRVRKLVDEPRTDPKWTDADILHELHLAFMRVVQELNGTSRAKIRVRYDLTLRVGVQNYALPPHIGSILEFAEIDANTGAVLGEYVPVGYYNPDGPTFTVEGNVLRMGLKPTSRQALRLTYVPNGEFRMHQGTIAAGSLTVTANSIVLAASPDQGVLDTRPNAYGGAMFRTIQTATGRQITRLISTYDAPTRRATVIPDWDDVPDADGSTDLKYEIIPIVGDALEDLVCLSAAIMIVRAEGNKDKRKELKDQFDESQRLLGIELRQRHARLKARIEMDDRLNPDAQGGLT